LWMRGCETNALRGCEARGTDDRRFREAIGLRYARTAEMSEEE
jgi:hypothetical protein